MRQPKWLESLRADVRTVAYFLGQCHRLSRTYLPLLCANVLQQLYNIINSLVVTRYIGDSAFAALGVAESVMNLFI